MESETKKVAVRRRRRSLAILELVLFNFGLSLNGEGAAHAACVTVASGSVSLYSDANKADVFELAAGGIFLTQDAAVTVVGKAADTVVVVHGAAAAE
jgi:hypothetical protein